MEFWNSLLIFYSAVELSVPRSARTSWMPFESATSFLVQNSFYISLIVIKAVKNKLINVNKTKIEAYTKALQKFNYETGIPLIKTLKINNELISYNLRKSAECLSPHLLSLFDRYSDVKLQANQEILYDQVFKEFMSLLKQSSTLIPVSLKTNTMAQKNSLVKTNTNSTANLASTADTKTNDLNVASRPSIEFDDAKAVPIHSKITSLTHFSDPKLIITPMMRSEPNITVDQFPRKCTRKYTLVLDLDETLIHFKNDLTKPKFLIRPYAYNFLKNLSSSYEIIIFTAAQKDYADWILDKIDSKKNIVYRLYREHCQMSKTSHLKDLRLIGRDLSKTLIVDNFAENFALHKENGICIRSWYGDLNDDVLIHLEKFLLGMAQANIDDVRPYLKAHIENDPEKGLLIVH